MDVTCAGLQSRSLERVRLVNSSLRQVFDLTVPGGAPRLAAIAVQQQPGGEGGSSHEDPPPDTDLARIFASLVMLRQLSTSAAFGRVGRASPEQARSEAGQDAGHQRAPEPLVSIREGAWRFADPVFDDAKIGTADARRGRLLRHVDWSERTTETTGKVLRLLKYTGNLALLLPV